MTTLEMFDKDVHAELDFPLDSVPAWFPLDGAAATLHVVRWPAEPGAPLVSDPARLVTVYAGVATYRTAEGGFEVGTYAAQIRLVADDAYGSTADSEIFRLVVHAAV